MRKMTKKLGVLLMIATILVGCGKKEKNSEVENSPKTASEQKSEKVYKVGILQFIDHVSLDAAREGFIDELTKNGIEAEIIYKNSNGDMSLTTTIAQSVINDDVDLVYAISTPSAQGAINVIGDKPMVFSAVSDPVEAGLVKSIEDVGGNVTGVSDYVESGKQVDEFLKLYPNVKTFGVLYNTSEINSDVQIKELEKVLNDRGLNLEKVGVNNINDIAQGITSLSNKIDALFAITDNLVANAAPVVSENLLEKKIPSLSSEEGQVKKGLLMSEGVNYYEHGAQAADIAIRILKGEEPKNIAVEYNKKNSKVVNKKTAEVLGIDLNSEVFDDANIIE